VSVTTTAATATAARRAEALGATLPPLLVAAKRVAATVASGVHGRRRVGQGDAFWEYRPLRPGESARRADPRASAKAARPFVRETEWEAAQTVLLWRDASPSMRWRSGSALPTKGERAELLLLALAALLLRGGERVALLDGAPRPRAGRAALEGLADQLGTAHGRNAAVDEDGMPRPGPLPRHARAVLLGDFLGPLDRVRERLAGMAGVGVGGHVLQVLDPAEAALPYAGRVRFRGLEGETDHLVASVEGVRDAYAAALAAQQRGLAALCAAAGWSFTVHRTDHPPEAALLGLHAALTRA
jgi:uncharacterized protein (DUF58 family)